MTSLPRIEMTVRAEDVVDVRVCALRRCPHFQALRGGGIGCTAGIYRARYPQDVIRDELARNPSAEPGAGADGNPLLCRMLVHRDSALPMCGVTQVEHTEKMLVADPAESVEPLFDTDTEGTVVT